MVDWEEVVEAVALGEACLLQETMLSFGEVDLALGQGWTCLSRGIRGSLCPSIERVRVERWRGMAVGVRVTCQGKRVVGVKGFGIPILEGKRVGGSSVAAETGHSGVREAAGMYEPYDEVHTCCKVGCANGRV